MRNTLEQISDAGHRFPRVDDEYQGQSTTFNSGHGFYDTNDGRGAPLVGVMIIAAIAFAFGAMIGFAIGRV